MGLRFRLEAALATLAESRGFGTYHNKPEAKEMLSKRRAVAHAMRRSALLTCAEFQASMKPPKRSWSFGLG